MASKKLKITSAANTTPILIQQLGGNLKGLIADNNNAAARFAKFFDSTDTPTVGTTVPFLTVRLPATSTAAPIFPADGMGTKGSLWVAFTVNAADSDNTAVGAGDVLATVSYD
jgi:hypothetical protein